MTSLNKYPKNWRSNGYGWHNSAALTYGGPQANSETSSGVSSLAPSAGGGSGLGWSLGGGQNATSNAVGSSPNIGLQMSYGFAPGVMPSQVPNAVHGTQPPPPGRRHANLGWAITADTKSFDGVTDVPAVQQDDTHCQAIHVPQNEMPIYGSYNVSIYIFT